MINPNDILNTMIGNINDTITISSTATTYDSSSVTNNSIYWGTGTSGQVLTTGTSGLSWAEPNLNGATLSVKGNAEFEGEVTIKGKNLVEALDKIEERLAILHPNPELEDKWDELKELGKRYKELEQDIIEKEKVWGILKK